MPIFEYECPECNGTSEVITLSMKEPAPANTPCRACGAMAARRFSVPTIKTNSTFFQRDKRGAEQFANDPLAMKTYVESARRAGVSIEGKTYQHGLAAYPGDPRAWVDDLGDAKRLAEERAKEGMSCPALGVKGRQIEPKESIGVDPTLVEERLNRMVARGELHESEKDKKREAVADMMTPDYKRSKAKYRPPKKKVGAKK